MTAIQPKSLTAEENWSSYRGFVHDRQKNRGAAHQQGGQWIYFLSQGHFCARVRLCFALLQDWMEKWAEPVRGAPSSQYTWNWRWESCVVTRWHLHLSPWKSPHARIHTQPSATLSLRGLRIRAKAGSGRRSLHGGKLAASPAASEMNGRATNRLHS